MAIKKMAPKAAPRAPRKAPPTSSKKPAPRKQSTVQTKPHPAGVRTKKTPPPSKGAQMRVSLTAPTTAKRNDVTFSGRVAKVERGDNEVVKNTTQAKRDPFAMSLGGLPDLPTLGDVNITLPTLGHMPDPIADAASEVRVFGPDLDESPVSEDDETLTNEDQEAVRLAELHGGFRQRMLAESKRRELATDTEYWVCVVFQDRDQKDQFLRGAQWDDLGDKYIDGERLADRLGVAVDKSEVTYNIGGADPKLVALVGIDPAYGSEPQQATRKRKSR